MTHAYWDREVGVRLEIESGDGVVVECAAPIGQVTPTWTDDDYANADPSLAHALSGAMYVKGARPGDTLEIDVLQMEHKGWGWSGHLPDFGLLADDFDSAHLHHWELDGAICRFADRIEVPAEPFPGVIGVAPRERGRLDTFPPRSDGGNLDTRDLVAGSTAWLPIHAHGALFSIGDCHSAQGDGEVLRERPGVADDGGHQVVGASDLDVAEFQARRRTRPALSDSDVHITTAHGPDLYENARAATRYIIEWLGTNCGLEPADAYLLCSAANLRISEIVDAPNWVVSVHFPLDIFR